MGYTIQYSPETNKRYPVRMKLKKRYGLIFSLLLVSVVLFFAVKHRSAVFRWLLPGDPDVTESALRGLVTDIQDGNTGDAIAAFCREIIDHAQQ